MPVAPVSPVSDSAHAKLFEKLLPSTVTGTTSSPPLVVSDVVTLTVKLALVVPFEKLRMSDVEVVGGKNASLAR